MFGFFSNSGLGQRKGLLMGLAKRLRRKNPLAPPDNAPDSQRPDTQSPLNCLDQVLSSLRAEARECIALMLDGNSDGQGCDTRLTRIRLRAALRLHDHILPMDNGRFLILAHPSAAYGDAVALQLARRLASATSPDWGASGRNTACLGVMHLPKAGPVPQPDAIMGALDHALNEAVSLGPGSIRVVAPPSTETTTRTSNSATTTRPAPSEPGDTRADLSRALSEGQFRAHFQPQISADSGEVTGFEALARWLHPARGLLQPAQFMPQIEASGLTATLGEAILLQALDAMRVWRRAGYEVPGVSVNVSRQELADPTYAERVIWQIDRFELPPSSLVLEVLETVAADRNRLTIVDNLTRLVQAGCRLDLDDFGIGPGALDSLRDFPVQRIKIDRSFVSKADHNPEQRRLLTAILSMSEQLGVETIAEGVETAAETSLLAQLGCHHLQGYAIARPMAITETTLFMERQKLVVASLPKIRRA